MRTLSIVICTFLIAGPALAQHDDSSPIVKPVLAPKPSASKLIVADDTRDGTPKTTRQSELMQMNF